MKSSQTSKASPHSPSLTSEEERTLWDFFSSIWPLPPAAWEALRPKFRKVYLDKDDVFLKAGDESTMAGFVSRGIIRAYYLDRHGANFTHSFLHEGTFCTAYAAFIDKMPAAATFEALEPTTIFEFQLKDFRNLFINYVEWCHIGRILVEAEYVAKVRRIESLLTKSAEQRFTEFATHHPQLLGRVNQIHLASYLGVTPESLSRLRRKMKSSP